MTEKEKKSKERLIKKEDFQKIPSFKPPSISDEALESTLPVYDKVKGWYMEELGIDSRWKSDSGEVDRRDFLISFYCTIIAVTIVRARDKKGVEEFEETLEYSEPVLKMFSEETEGPVDYSIGPQVPEERLKEIYNNVITSLQNIEVTNSSQQEDPEDLNS